MLPEIERRSLPGAEVRAAEGGRRITGYAAIFGSLSEDLGGFREVILPSAFDRALREGHDVRALVDHNPEKVLARTPKTLTLTKDTRGLRVEISPGDYSYTADAIESIRRGDRSGMSFAFRTITDDWRKENGQTIREVSDLELLDVSVVVYPAYQATQVSTRALEHARAGAPPATVPTPGSGVPLAVLEAMLELYEG